MLFTLINIMEQKKHPISFVFFLAMLMAADVVNASRVTTERRLRAEMHSKVQLRKTMMRDRFIRRRLSLREDGQARHKDICAEIVGPKWNLTKQGKGPCPKLLVWVPKKTGFFEFVELNEQDEVEGGFSIAIFCYALHALPFSVQPTFKPFINDKGESNGTYNQLLMHIEGKTCQAVAGDVTVRASRTQYVDFTSSYLSSEVYMLVGASHEWNQTLWTFLKPFTWRLWIAIVGICIYIGLAIAILEYRVGNPKFSGATRLHKVVMVIWFPISTFFFQGRILNNNTKVVLVMWLSMIYIVGQIFTAVLSAWLTLDQLRPRLPSTFENVGYQNGSFMKDFINQKYNCSSTNLKPLNCSSPNLKPLNNIEEYKNALYNGSVNVIFAELPYIELFLAKYDSNYMKFGPINQESGFAFALAHGSPLLQNFSRAVINVTESDIMMRMKEKYLGFRVPDGSQPIQPLPQKLDVQGFIGLFVFIVTLTIVVIIFSEISLRRHINNKIEPISTELKIISSH